MYELLLCDAILGYLKNLRNPLKKGNHGRLPLKSLRRATRVHKKQHVEIMSVYTCLCQGVTNYYCLTSYARNLIPAQHAPQGGAPCSYFYRVEFSCIFLVRHCETISFLCDAGYGSSETIQNCALPSPLPTIPLRLSCMKSIIRLNKPVARPSSVVFPIGTPNRLWCLRTFPVLSER